MKNLLVLCFVAVFAVIGCKNPTEKQAAVTTTTPAPPPPPAPVDTAKPILAGGSTVHCYQFVDKSKDAHSCQISTRATPNPFVSGYFDWSPF